jgi:hypothetical protein
MVLQSAHDLPVSVRAGTKDKLQGLGSVARDMNMVGQVMLPERMKRQFHVVGIVFNEQNLDCVIHGQPPFRE